MKSWVFVLLFLSAATAAAAADQALRAAAKVGSLYPHALAQRHRLYRHPAQYRQEAGP